MVALAADRIPPHEPVLAARLAHLGTSSRAGVLLIAGLVLVGWLAGAPALTSLGSDSDMKLNTALALAALAVAAGMVQQGRAVRAARVLASVAGVVGAVTLFENLSGVGVGIDELLVDDPMGTGAPGRMSTVSSACVALYAGAILLAAEGRTAWAFGLSAPTFVTSAIALLAHLYGAEALLALPGGNAIGAPASFALVLTGLGVFPLCAPALVTGDTAAGAFVRRFLPASWVALLLLGALRLWMAERGLLDQPTGVAMLVASSAIAIAAGVAVLGAPLARTEQTLRRAQDALAAHGEVLEVTIDAMRGALVALDEHGIVTRLNHAAEELLGRDRAEAVGRPVGEVIVLRAEDGAPVSLEPGGRSAILHTRAGSLVPVWLACSPLRSPRGQHGSVLVVHDLREEQRARAARERDRLFDLALDLVTITRGDRFVQVSEASERILGWRPDEMTSAGWRELVHPDDVERTLAAAAGLAEAGSVVGFVNRYRHKDGSYRMLEWQATSAPDGLLYGMARDVTERERAAEQLRSALDERDVLLREVHHRVKNNLQLVTSMLRLQLRELAEGPARAALQDSLARVHSISLIHEQLHQRETHREVRLRSYVGELVAAASELQPMGTRIEVTAQVPEGLSLPLEAAIPLGLILNELLSNALKHAFRGRSAGRIAVTVTGDDAHVLITVEDDGVGLPADLELAASGGSVGMQIVRSLVQQLEGMLEVQRLSPGTLMALRIPRPR